MAMTLDNPATALSLDVARTADEGTGLSLNTDTERTHSESSIVNRFTVVTTRFGTFEADAELVLTFPDGLIGFEACKRFIVVRPNDNSPFRWLQSLNEPGVAFPIVEPGSFRADYAPTIADSDARFLELRADTPALLFVIVTIPRQNPREMTANLLGPLVINGLTQRGKQTIVQNPEYTTRHRLLDERNRKTEAAVAVSSAKRAA